MKIAIVYYPSHRGSGGFAAAPGRRGHGLPIVCDAASMVAHYERWYETIISPPGSR